MSKTYGIDGPRKQSEDGGDRDDAGGGDSRDAGDAGNPLPCGVEPVRVLITSNSHAHYNQTGKIELKAGKRSWVMTLDNGTKTKVREGQFKPVSIQD